jgi:hypothetical protein
MWDQVLLAIKDCYQQKIIDLQKQIDETRDSAAKSPGSMQSWPDKSKQEFTQLADTLSKNLAPLQSSLKQVQEIAESHKTSDNKKVEVGSIIKTQSAESENNEYLVIVPEVGGEQITVSGVDYFLLSVKSELGKNLLDKNVGDKIILRSGSEIFISEIINS